MPGNGTPFGTRIIWCIVLSTSETHYYTCSIQDHIHISIQDNSIQLTSVYKICVLTVDVDGEHPEFSLQLIFNVTQILRMQITKYCSCSICYLQAHVQIHAILFGLEGFHIETCQTCITKDMFYCAMPNSVAAHAYALYIN